MPALRNVCVFLHENYTSAKGLRILGILVQQLHEGSHEPSLPAGMLDEVD